MMTRLQARQRGGAILLAVLTAALVAMLAAGLLDVLAGGIDSLSGRHDQAQARLLARGATDWARNVLADDQRRTPNDHLGEPWAIRVPPTPVEDGEVAGELTELSGRFNLNMLAPDGKPNAAEIERFARLLELAGDPPAEARLLAERLADWIDHDLQRFGQEGDEGAGAGGEAAPNAPLGHVDELLRIPGFGPERLRRLAPLIAALPTPSRINVNTAPAEVLAATLESLTLDAARLLLAERERAWFKDLADFNARLNPDGDARHGSADAGRFDVGSRFFLATGRARYGVAVVRMEILLDRRDVWPNIIWQRLL